MYGLKGSDNSNEGENPSSTGSTSQAEIASIKSVKKKKNNRKKNWMKERQEWTKKKSTTTTILVRCGDEPEGSGAK